MVTDQQIGRRLTRVLQDHTSDVFPRPDLADRVIRRRHAGRFRSRLTASAATAVAGLAVLLAGAIPGAHAGHDARLQLAGYSFTLPNGSREVPASPAACAIGAGVIYTPGPGEGAGNADQPAIANAVTAGGGCVSMLLTDPYTPGAGNAPSEPFPVVDQHQVQIGTDTGTIGTYKVVGENMTFNGTPVPTGTEHLELNLQIPASDGQVQDLQVAAAGLSEQQLVTIVTSGLASTS